MHKSAIFGLFLMASLLMGTSLNMNMFTSASAQGMGQYGNDPYGSSYGQSYGYDAQPSYGPQQPSYDQPKPSYDQPRQDYKQSSYGDYSDYKTKDKKYECRTGPFEGFFVGSVEFCDAKHDKFDKDDDRKDRDKKVGPQGPPGPPGANGTDGRDGVNGTDGRDGVNGTDGRDGTNGTDFDPCVACLLDALVKLDSGALLVNVTIDLTPVRSISPTVPVNITLPLVIEVNVALLLQQQLAVDLGLNANATIFEICAAIDAQGLDVGAVLASLEVDLGPIVEAQITQIVSQIIIALETILHITIPDEIVQAIIDRVDIDSIIAEILVNVEVSLGIFEACLGLEPTIPENGPVIPEAIIAQQLPTIQEMNPSVQQNNLPSGDPMLQLQSSLSPIL